MGKVQIKIPQARLSERTLEAARLVANAEIGAFYKALAVDLKPEAYAAPKTSGTSEARYAKMIRSATNKAKASKALAAFERNVIQVTPEARKARFLGLGGVSFAAAESVRDQVVRAIGLGQQKPRSTKLPFMLPIGLPLPPGGGAPTVPPNAVKMHLKLQRLKCVHMTSKSLLETDPDSIDIGGLTVTADGATVRIATVFAGNQFRAGTEKRFADTPTLGLYNVSPTGPFPQVFLVALAMEERDDANPFAWMQSIYEGVRDALASDLGRPVRDELEALADDESVSQWAEVIRSVAEWIAKEVFPALGNDAFRPQTVTIEVPDRAALADLAPVAKTLTFSDHGGQYIMDVLADWIRVEAADSVDARPVERLVIDLRTGGDDLRDQCVAEGVLRLRNGTQLKKDLNERAGWANNSSRQVTWIMPAGTKVGDLQNFGIHFTSVRRGFPYFDTGDNWNLDGVKVHYVGPKGDGNLLTVNGSPIVRFTENEVRDWSHALAPSG